MAHTSRLQLASAGMRRCRSYNTIPSCVQSVTEYQTVSTIIRRLEDQEARNPKSATGSMTLDPRMASTSPPGWRHGSHPSDNQVMLPVYKYIWNHEVESAPRVLEAENSRSLSIVRGLINRISHRKLGDGLNHCHLMGFYGSMNQ